MSGMDINQIRKHNLMALIGRFRSQRAFADAVDTAPAYISQILTKTRTQTGKERGVGGDLARKIEEKLGLPRGWMDTIHNEDGREPSNVGHGPDIGGKVPLISWVQAGRFSEIIDARHSDETFERIDTTVPTKRYTFALRVEGDSMEPNFPAGTTIIVEPELEAHAGDYVIAVNGDGQATFKQLVKDGGDWYLKPLNPRYPLKPLTGCHIVGVVRAAERRFR
jgi:SOS-response transcriptional repressor LexA